MVKPDGPQDGRTTPSPEQAAVEFERMVATETSFLYALARGQLGDADRASDAVQETILKAWQHRHTLRNPAAFKSWLGSILIRTCHSLRRKGKREAEAATQRERLNQAEDPAGAALAPERQAELAEVLRTLDEEDQMILALKYSQGLKYEQIAEELKLSTDAVRGRLFRAKEELRRRLKERGR